MTTRRPAASTQRCSAGRPDDEGRAAVEALGEDELQRAADRDDLLERGLEAQAPELSHVLLGGELRVVRDERDALAGGAQGRDGVDGAGRRRVAEPDAAVEVEQDVVVAGDEGAERHGAKSDRWPGADVAPRRHGARSSRRSPQHPSAVTVGPHRCRAATGACLARDNH